MHYFDQGGQLVNQKAVRHGGEGSRFDVASLVLVAMLLAAGFILNMTVGKALSMTGIQPEFVISSYCLAILLLRPTLPHGVLIGVLAATVIQFTTSIPGLEYVCDIPASLLMAAIVRLTGERGPRGLVPFLSTCVTTAVSGLIFATLATVVVLRGEPLAVLAMLPIVVGTALANAIVVQSLYLPLRSAFLQRLPSTGEASGTSHDDSDGVVQGVRAEGGSNESLDVSTAATEAVPDVYPGAAAVELQHVSFTYDGARRRALDDVSLTFGAGSFVGVIGPSGAGKTTLASVVSGAIPHHFAGEFRGAALVGGMDTCEVALTDVSRVVGSVLQDIDAQMVAADVEDEILYGLENFGFERSAIEKRVSYALRTAGIEDLRRREISTLSGGQKQKVAIAAILAISPRVMVLDEPTAALDPASSRMVFETLRELNARGITVIVIEQKVALLSEYCDRVIVLSQGSVALDGSPREVFSHSKDLRDIGVDSPRVTRISNGLAVTGVLDPAEKGFLTVSQARDGLLGLLSSTPVKAASHVAPSASPHRLATPAPTGDPMLSLRDVSFSYGVGKASVDHVCFDVGAGELVAVVGQNGAGKTTLTKLMNGLLKPGDGSVNICGLDTRRARTSEIAQKVSTLFQNPDHQICRQTVLEEVAFSLQLLGVPDDEAFQRAADVVSYFGLDPEAAPFTLSRGQRQIVALASVVVTNPKVMILDEPTSGLDYRECMTVMDSVNAARERGCAVVMVCHDMEVVSDYATRLIVMANGRVLEDGEPSVLFSRAELLGKACIAPPQVSELSQGLADAGFERFRGITEVKDIVDVMKGLVG